ncbi:hypothetical protein ACJX0J_031680, partial [Zea mays]
SEIWAQTACILGMDCRAASLTTFQTHICHFKFRVMVFGLVGTVLHLLQQDHWKDLDTLKQALIFAPTHVPMQYLWQRILVWANLHLRNVFRCAMLDHVYDRFKIGDDWF